MKKDNNRLKDRLPVRRVIRRGHASFISYSPSTKSVWPNCAESALEYDELRRAEGDPSVRRIWAQPEILEWNDHGKIRTHIPDFLLDKGDVQEFVEVKPYRKSLDPEFIRRTDYLRKQEMKRGRHYRVATERTIRAEPAFTNAKILCQGVGQEPTKQLRQHVVDTLRSAGAPMTLADIVHAVSQPPGFINSLYWMILRRYLALINTNIQVERDSLVHLGEGAKT